MIEDWDGTPGTIKLLDNDGRVEKHDHEVRLVPTPSSDPQDPLNWTTWRKYLQLFCIAL